MTSSDRDSSSTKSEKIGDHVTIILRGKKWYANYQFNGKQIRKSLGTTSLKEARRKALLIEAELLEGRHTQEIKARSVKEVTDAYVQYLEAKQRRPKTMKKIRLVVRRVLALATKRRAVTMQHIDLSFADAYELERIKEMQEKWKKTPAKKTLHNDMTILKQIAKFAFRRKLIDSNPLKEYELVKPKRTPQPCWTKSEVNLILEAAAPQYRSALTLLAETGMRVGELEWLTWKDIDFERGLIHIRPKDDWQPKTGDQRSIPMSALARKTLQVQPKKYRWVFTMTASQKFPQGDGQLKERRLLVTLKTTLSKLGLVGKLHTFRHSFISHALATGIAEATVRKWVGHVDRDILDHYTHINDQVSAAAMQRLSDASPQPRTDGGGDAAKM